MAAIATLAASLVGVQGGKAALPATQSIWFAIPANLDSNGHFLSIDSDITATFEVTSADGGVFSTGTVSPGSPFVVPLPDAGDVSGSESIGMKGIHITSSAPVVATLLSDDDNGGTSGATLLYPQSALGQSYIAVGYQQNTVPNAPSQFTIVGTADQTGVSVTPTCAGSGGGTAGTPIALTLDPGDTWQYECPSSDVTGSTITADKKIAVFGGNRCAVIDPGDYCDYLVEQMVPVNRWGKQFLLAPLDDGQTDYVRIVTSAPSTTLTAQGLTVPVSIPLAGSHYTTTMTGASRITANKPIFVAQYMSGHDLGAGDGDPLMIGVQPASSATKDHRFFAFPGVAPYDYTTSRVNVIAPNGATVKLDGSAVGGFTALPGGTHRWATVDLQPGEHRVRASAPVLVYVYGMRPLAAYGFVAGDPASVPTTTTVSFEKTATRVRATGGVKPNQPGYIVVVKLYRKSDGRWRIVATRRPRLSPQSKYAAAFDRPRPGPCKLTARFPGTDN